MHIADDAVAVNQVRGRHGLDIEVFGTLLVGVRSHGKIGGKFGEKRLGVLRYLVQVDADNLQTLVFKVVMQLVQKRKGLRARGAPRRPEVHVNHFAFKLFKIVA